jgi:uncharacterized membrane-anchored protein YjiN (DUF445 family)
MGKAALIGGLCDYIALKMIFEQRWYLPNSGVLPRNRLRLIEGIATTIENEWLTPEMIKQKLDEIDLLATDILAKVKRSRSSLDNRQSA